MQQAAISEIGHWPAAVPAHAAACCGASHQATPLIGTDQAGIGADALVPAEGAGAARGHHDDVPKRLQQRGVVLGARRLAPDPRHQRVADDEQGRVAVEHGGLYAQVSRRAPRCSAASSRGLIMRYIFTHHALS